jgi:long-chain fatty acid transport protein
MKSLRRCVVGAGAVALAYGAWSPDAKAAGFANTRIGGEQGSVVATNPTALYYNPGAMGFAHGSQLALYGSLALRHATWDRAGNPTTDTPDPAGAQGANTGSAHILNAFGGPSLGGTLKLGNFTIGAGFFAPFYGRAHWPTNDSFNNPKYPLADAGVQRWFSIDGALSVLYFTAGAAYRFGPLSIGVSGNVVSTTIDQTQAKNTAGQGVPDTSQEGRAFLDASAFNPSAAAGIMLEAVPNQFWIGASYQSQPGFGQQKLHGELLLHTPGVSQADVDFLQTLPDIIRAGVRWKLKNAPLEFRLFGDMTRWSSFKTQCLTLHNAPCNINADGTDATQPTSPVQANVVRNWNDTYGGRLGVSWWVSPAVELLFGTGYETAAVPDSTLAPDLPDAINISGTFGARFMVTESLFLTASYTHIQYLNRDNTGKSTLAADSMGNTVAYPTVEEDAGGKYTQWIGVFTGNLEALF